MDSLQSLQTQTSGSVQQYKVLKAKTVKDLLDELNLSGKAFVLLVNGKRANLDQMVEENTEITILPKIAGGLF